MGSATSDHTALAATVTQGWKLAVAGGFGVGKTTFVSSISEIAPLSTEAEMTQASVGVDDLAPTPDKSTTTVAFDFGRVSLGSDMVLYLFGAPGQQRFTFLWQRLFTGALGAVVLVDTRRLADSFAPLDRVEQMGMPYVVVHNVFGTEDRHHTTQAIREALWPDEPHKPVPVLPCDARSRASVREVLIALVEHVQDHVRRSTAPEAIS